jgi:hypothetical protein
MQYLEIMYPNSDEPDSAKYRAIVWAEIDGIKQIVNIAEGDDFRTVVLVATEGFQPTALKMPNGSLYYPDEISVGEAAEAVYLI